MKKYIILLLALSLGLGLQAQRTLTTDTLKGAETINFATMQDAKLVTAVFTNVGGTSDGTATLYGSHDGSTWTFLNMIGNVLGISSPQASVTGSDLNQVTITTALTASWFIQPDTYPYHRLTTVGTSADTTQVVVHWSKWR